MNSKFSTEDLNPMSWEEYGRILDGLTEEISTFCQEERVSFDIVAPIARSGLIPGGALAVSLRVPIILPLQFRHHQNPPRLDQPVEIPKIRDRLPDYPSILITESNTCTGEIARAVVVALKSRFHQSRLFYASVARVHGGPKSIEGTEQYFRGVETDEQGLASAEELKSLSLRPKITIFPWENVEDELREVNAVVM